MVQARPTLMLGLTGLPSTWRETQARITELRRILVRAGATPEWTYSVEVNPNRTGHHLHGLVSGAISEHLLAGAVSQVGLGQQFDLRSVVHTRGLGYGLKSACHSQAALAEFLQVNGGRLEHHSRRFFKDAAGRPCALDEAIAAARGRRGDPSPWVLVRENQPEVGAA
jgi:hypothetical protein